MVTEERREELESLFWSETEVLWTEEWRENLTDEEECLVREWDERVSRGMRNLCMDLIKRIRQREDGA